MCDDRERVTVRATSYPHAGRVRTNCPHLTLCPYLLIVAGRLEVSAKVGFFGEPSGAAAGRQVGMNVGCTTPTRTLALFMRCHASIKVISLSDIDRLPLILLIHPREDVVSGLGLELVADAVDIVLVRAARCAGPSHNVLISHGNPFFMALGRRQPSRLGIGRLP